jgi:outer membrane protein assembly factor BamB
MTCQFIRDSRVFRSLFWQLGLTVWILGVCCSSDAVAQAPSESAEAVRPAMDRYDLRAAEDPDRSERLELVRKSFERQRWDEGAKTLQSLFDDEHDSLVFGDDQIWRTVTESAIALLKSAPPEAMTAYLAHAEVIAARDFKQALATHDPAALARVARRYLLTSDGQRASRELIDLAIDSGNFDSVAGQLQQLSRLESPQLADPVWRSQMIRRLKSQGAISLAERIEQRFGTALPMVADGPWRAPETERISSASWTSVQGTPDGQAPGQLLESIPLVRWRVPVLTHEVLIRVIDEHMRKVLDTSTLGLHVLSTAGAGDVVVTRTLSGLMAVRASTGDVLWTSRDWGPQLNIEEELTDQPVLPLATGNREFLGQRIAHRQLLCPSLGALSIDSRRVYSLAHFPNERDQLELLIQSSFAETDEGELPEATYLVARDLMTGQVVWRAGGLASDGFPGLPCEGAFLFGPPTCYGEDLFVVGERDGDVQLFCLEAETGLVRWEQLLASSGRDIELDSVRKCWTAPVSVRGSLVICPTTTGWVTAVDRITRRIVWSSRLHVHDPSEEVTESSFDARNRESSINERWAPAQPLIVGDRVLITAMEFPDEHSRHSAELVCLDALTGQKLWSLPKEEQLGLVGCRQNRVITFESGAIYAWDLSSGAQLWKVVLAERLAGRPVLTDRGVVLPMASGELQILSPDDGKFQEASEAGSTRLLEAGSTNGREHRLGNLITVAGRIVSTSNLELLTFEWKSEVARWEAESKTSLPAALRQAQSLAFAGETDEAAKLLRESISLTGQDAEQLELLRATRFSVLMSALSRTTTSPPVAVDSERLQELRSLIRTPVERSAIDRLEIELAISKGDWQAAWTRLKEMMIQPVGAPVAVPGGFVHSDQWIADQILEMGRLAEATARAAARAAVQEEFSRLWSAADEAGRKRLIRQFAETGRVDRELSQAIQSGALPQQLSRWQILTESPDPEIAQAATLRIIDALAVPDWVKEARRRFAELPAAEQWPPDLRPNYEATRQKLEGVVDLHSESGPSWLGRKIDIQRIGDSSAESVSGSRLLLHWIGEPCPGLARFDYVYDSRLRSILILRGDGSLYWEMKLATNEINPIDEEAPIVHAAGLNLYLMHMGVLHAFSPVERRSLWRRNVQLERGDSLGGIWRSVARRSRLYAVKEWRDELKQNSDEEERVLEVATPAHVVLRLDRSIQVLDASDGTVQWSMVITNPAPIRADQDRIYGVDPTVPWCRSIRSGRLINAPDLGRPESPMVVMDSPQLLGIAEAPGDGLSWKIEATRLSALRIPSTTGSAPWDFSDDVTLAPAWTVAVPSDSQVGRGPAGSIVSLLSTGEVRLIDWKTGQVQVLGTARIPELARCYVGADLHRFYLTYEVGDGHGELDVPSLPAFGTLAAFPLDDPALPSWQVETQGFLITRGTRRAPFLPILRLENQTLGDRNYQRVHLQLIDKATGKLVYEMKNSPSYGLGVSSCDYDSRRRQWLLFLAAERIRLSPAREP